MTADSSTRGPGTQRTNETDRYRMTNETFKDIEKLESDLWEAAELVAKIQENFEELGI